VVAGAKVDSHLLVVFGGLGDLAQRKLIPAIYSLQSQSRLGSSSAVLAVDTLTDMDDDSYRSSLLEASASYAVDYGRWCGSTIHYAGVSGSESDYAQLSLRVRELEQRHSLPGNRIFYLAVPPAAVVPIVQSIHASGLVSVHGWTRLVLEKPFGHDLASARDLNHGLHEFFDEESIYRIDHYLGKETVQNLLAFRFANSMFEHLWNSDHVESIEITATESIGVGNRAAYYDSSGVVRDMVQNHLCQLMSLVGMEPSESFDARHLRQQKLRFLDSVAPAARDQSVLGQYSEGIVDGAQMLGYRQERGVPRDSRTPTFAAIRLEVNNERWAGVPFFLMSGKRLGSRHSHIAIQFRDACASIFRPHETTCGLRPNLLLVTLQPDEGFDIRFQVKQPGPEYLLSSQLLRFRYDEAFGPLPDAYESLLQDVALGTAAHFVCDAEIEAAWRVVEPLLQTDEEPLSYVAGSRGPSAMDTLGARWIDPEEFHNR